MAHCPAYYLMCNTCGYAQKTICSVTDLIPMSTRHIDCFLINVFWGWMLSELAICKIFKLSKLSAQAIRRLGIKMGQCQISRNNSFLRFLILSIFYSSSLYANEKVFYIPTFLELWCNHASSFFTYWLTPQGCKYLYSLTL